MSRFWSLADMEVPPVMSALPPKAGIGRRAFLILNSTRSGSRKHIGQQRARSFAVAVRLGQKAAWKNRRAMANVGSTVVTRRGANGNFAGWIERRPWCLARVRKSRRNRLLQGNVL